MAYTRTVCSSCLRALRRGAARNTTTSPANGQGRRFTSASTSSKITPLPWQRIGGNVSQRLNPRKLGQGRFFTASATQQRIVLNPRQDDEGKPMDVEITPRASHRLSELMATESNPDLLLRVRVESGGCHGFQYLMSLTSRDAISEAEDTIFESEDGKGAKVVMDEPSLELLKGSKVDYSMELIGSQFKIADNPYSTSSCGCGTSFDIKI